MGKLMVAFLFIIALAGIAGSGWFYMEGQQLRSEAVEVGAKLAEAVALSRNAKSQMEEETAKVVSLEDELNRLKEQFSRLESALKVSKQAAVNADMEKRTLQQKADMASANAARERGDLQGKLEKVKEENNTLQSKLKSLQIQLEMAKAAVASASAECDRNAAVQTSAPAQ